MAQVDKLLAQLLSSLPPKPPPTAGQALKKRYSEQISAAVAQAFAEELRSRGFTETQPTRVGTGSGAERRMAGGIGAKKVDVTWATEESGLVFGISIKSINWRDPRTNNYQKNLTNRRGDMLFESVTLHRRFPYAVLTGFLFLDEGAAEDGTTRRASTFENAHKRLKIFTGRSDPLGRDEQYERLYIALLSSDPKRPGCRFFSVGDPKKERSLGEIFDELVAIVAERNPDEYEEIDGVIRSAQ